MISLLNSVRASRVYISWAMTLSPPFPTVALAGQKVHLQQKAWTRIWDYCPPGSQSCVSAPQQEGQPTNISHPSNSDGRGQISLRGCGWDRAPFFPQATNIHRTEFPSHARQTKNPGPPSLLPTHLGQGISLPGRVSQEDWWLCARPLVAEIPYPKFCH